MRYSSVTDEQIKDIAGGSGGGGSVVNLYSETEIQIGKLDDGREVYRKLFINTEGTTGAVFNIGNINKIDYIITNNCCCEFSGKRMNFNNGQNYCDTVVDENGDILVYTNGATWISTLLEYTKKK